MRVRRHTATAAAVAFLVVATWTAFGPPEPVARLRPFFVPSSTAPALEAVIGLLAWTATALAAMVVLTGIARGGVPEGFRRRGTAQAAILAAGCFVLAASVAHVAFGYHPCCSAGTPLTEVTSRDR